LTDSIKTKALKKVDIVPFTKFSVPAGANGFLPFRFEVKEIKPHHRFDFSIRVLQPSGRNDLDIGFSVMDDDNYHSWLSRQPHMAFIIVPKFTFGTLTFMPSNIGLYHAVLDNRYSVFTVKEVEVNICEVWIEEKEVKMSKPQEKVEAPKQSLLQRFLNKIRFS
jgi:hypothetical protein